MILFWGSFSVLEHPFSYLFLGGLFLLYGVPGMFILMVMFFSLASHALHKKKVWQQCACTIIVLIIAPTANYRTYSI